uniref:Movement protein TGB2 n=1 Tax=Melon yellowing-associated virus TaxID=255255 RepID=D1MYB2_9VIRU|nr:triple gene block protein 2 [Melon yellowing-associated virus]
MSLTPPADYSKSLLAIAIGSGVALAIYTTTRSTLPHVGDSQYSLPHGGTYCDAAKKVIYGSPQRGTFDWLYTSGSYSFMIPFILCLTSVIIALSFSDRKIVCPRCGGSHS